MKPLKIITATLIAGFGLSQAVLSNPAQAQSNTRIYRSNLLIMVQDDDPDTTPARRQRIMSRIVGGVSDVLNRNLRTMLDYMSIMGQVNIAGSKIVVQKVLSR